MMDARNLNKSVLVGNYIKESKKFKHEDPYYPLTIIFWGVIYTIMLWKSIKQE